MSISVIISNFNGDRFLPKLLDSLSSQQDVNLEIIVVDRNSRDKSLEILAQYPQVKVVQEPPETGLVSGYTAGYQYSQYEHLFFCNEDMWFEPDCLKNLEAKIDLANRIGAADPWQWTYQGEEWIHGGVRFEKCSLFAFGSPYPLRVLNFTVDLKSGEKVPLPCAGAFLVHRTVFEDIGGWDTSFFLDHEDIDLFVRAWQKDWWCVTVPEAKVYHAVGASTGQTINTVQQTVGQRRYISSVANKSIIGLKYFSPMLLPLAFHIWLVNFMKNVLKLRLKYATWDLLALKQIFDRLSEVVEFRSKNTVQNLSKPGEKFFTETEYLVNSVEIGN